MVTPLDSSKKEHKVVAVYVSVANLSVHLQSNTDHMSLVLLCEENDLKQFGAKVFSEMFVDFGQLFFI